MTMASSYKFYFLTVLLSCIIASAAIDPYPLGVNFGPNYITAAYIAAADEPVPVVSIVGSDEYRAYVADSRANVGRKIQMHGQWYIRDGESLIPTPEDAQNDTKVEAPFTSALSDIKDAAMKTLKRSVDITSISVPQYFNRSSTSYIKHAALNAERLFTRPWQAKPFFNAVRLANGLNFCKGSGPGPASCHIEDDPHVFIFADYHKEYLEFVIVDVEDEMYEIINSTRLENLGANRLGTTSDGTNDSGKDTYQKEIQNAFQEFIDHNFIKPNRTSYFEELRGIVMSGEAPEPAFANVRNSVVAVLPEHQDKIRDSIDPPFCRSGRSRTMGKASSFET